MTYAQICESVARLRRRYGDSDPARLCREMEIQLLYQPLGSHPGAIKGYFIVCKRIRAITVNMDLPPVMQRIITAHELGHAVHHKSSRAQAFHDVVLFDQTSALEKEANLFAAELLLREGQGEAIRARMEDLKKRRQDKQPLELPSAGSTFKRPEGYYAGKLIMDAGLRGAREGGASVSEKHCGFIVNDRSASAKDVIRLMNRVRRTVYEQFGVMLEPEVRLLGDFHFSENETNAEVLP